MAEYRVLMEQIADFLSGKYEKLVAELRREMLEASRNLEFERAATLRDRTFSIERVIQRQVAAAQTLRENRDAIGIAPGVESRVVVVVEIRGGRVSSGEHYRMVQAAEAEDAELIENFLLQHYGELTDMPGEILVPELPEESAVIEELLSERAGRRVQIYKPARGRGLELLRMAQQNAIQVSMRDKKREEQVFAHMQAAQAELAAVCGLKSPPHRIEGYDISNTQGVYSVASMVVFEDGKPARQAYRRFRIKTVEGANDFASLAETVTRRFRRQMDGDDKFLAQPDLIMIDGGPQQLRFVSDALKAIGVSANLCSLAKREEEIYLVGREDAGPPAAHKRRAADAPAPARRGAPLRDHLPQKPALQKIPGQCARGDRWDRSQAARGAAGALFEYGRDRKRSHGGACGDAGHDARRRRKSLSHAASFGRGGRRQRPAKKSSSRGLSKSGLRIGKSWFAPGNTTTRQF